MRWRQIKTAPKNEHILLKYPSFADDGKMIANQGIWVDVAHTNIIQAKLNKGQNPDYLEPELTEGHWEVAYVAILQYGGHWNGKSFEPRSVRVEPTHWQPLPKT